MSMIDNLNEAFESFKKEISDLNSQPEVLNLKSSYLGKKGKISDILKSLKDATPEQRKEIGPVANKIKDDIQVMIAKKLAEIELVEINEKLAKDRIDVTYTDSVKAGNMTHGGLHPRTLIREEIEDVFLSMGFEVY